MVYRTVTQYNSAVYDFVSLGNGVYNYAYFYRKNALYNYAPLYLIALLIRKNIITIILVSGNKSNYNNFPC